MLQTQSRIYAAAAFAAFIPIASAAAAAAVLHNLGGLVGLFLDGGADGKFDFVRIFAQTREAGLTVHFLWPLMFGVLFFLAFRLGTAKIPARAARIGGTFAVYLLLLLSAFIASLLFSRVNGIRFIDLLAKLLPLIDKL